MDTRPIGILDSGVGGLTVWKEILRELPHESTVYIGDSLHAPYGKRTPGDIRLLTARLIRFLLQKNVKLIVIACNTITVNGIDIIRQQFPQIPIVGTVPVIKLAAATTKNKKIGVLVTKATEKSKYNADLIKKFASDCEVITIGTNALVPLIEARNNKELPGIIAQELSLFRQKKVDVIVLGSTHFPILKPFLRDFLGEHVSFLDSGGAIARQVSRILTTNKALSEQTEPFHELFTTGQEEQFQKVVELLIGNSAPMANHAVVQ